MKRAGCRGNLGSGGKAVKTLCWLLIAVGALAFAVGTVLAFSGTAFLLPPVGYWRGAVAFVLFAVALRLMEAPR